ncbi:hypothetical protein AN1V17_14120 [Vallitalea sediminicola]
MKKNKKAIYIVGVLLIILVFSGCSAKKSIENTKDNSTQDNGNMVNDTGFSKENEATANTEKKTSDKIQAKIIQNNNISMETLVFDECTMNLEKEIHNLDGYIEESNVEGKRINDYGEIQLRNAYYTFRVPKDNYMVFLKSIGDLGNIISEHKTTEDITLRYFDNETRLEAKRIHKDRLLELLKETKDVDQLLAVESELANITYEIEAMTTELRKWDNLIDYVTVRVSVEEVVKVTPGVVKEDSYGSRFTNSIKDSLDIFTKAIGNLIIGIVYLVPYLVILGLIVLIIIRVKKILKKEKKIKQDKLNRKKNK